MEVIYKECIIIDDQEYTVLSRDYSNSISEAIADGILEGDSQGIIDYIAADLEWIDAD
jgi:hypothetical protein